MSMSTPFRKGLERVVGMSLSKGSRPHSTGPGPAGLSSSTFGTRHAHRRLEGLGFQLAQSRTQTQSTSSTASYVAPMLTKSSASETRNNFVRSASSMASSAQTTAAAGIPPATSGVSPAESGVSAAASSASSAAAHAVSPAEKDVLPAETAGGSVVDTTDPVMRTWITWLKFLDKIVATHVDHPKQYPKTYDVKEFGWHQFNKLGEPNPWAHIGCIQLVSYLFFPVVVKKVSEFSFFGRTLSVDWTPEYHATDFVGRPIKYVSHFGFFGNSTVYITVELRDAVTNAHYMTAIPQFIMIDLKTMMPCQIPDHLVPEYGDRTTLKEKPGRLRFEKRPEESTYSGYVWRKRVDHSDEDHNSHLNMTPHMRMALDAATCGALAGRFPTFTREMVYYKIKNYSIEYTRPITVGSEVDVVCWESESDPTTIHFEFEDDGVVTCQSRISFFKDACKL